MTADAQDTTAVATVDDHPFQPREEPVVMRHTGSLRETVLPPNPHLCKVCRLAKAAHLS